MSFLSFSSASGSFGVGVGDVRRMRWIEGEEEPRERWVSTKEVKASPSVW